MVLSCHLAISLTPFMIFFKFFIYKNLDLAQLFEITKAKEVYISSVEAGLGLEFFNEMVCHKNVA